MKRIKGEIKTSPKASPISSPKHEFQQQAMSQRTGPTRADVQDLPLPTKLTNQHTIRNVEQAKIVMNSYQLDTSGAVEQVFKHELKFTGIYPSRAEPSGEKEKDLSRGPKNDVAAETRRRLLWEMYQQMLETNQNVFGPTKDHKMYIYDCGINFYSVRQLMSQGESKEYKIDTTSLPEPCRIYLGTKIRDVKARLLACETVNLRSKDALTESRNRSVVQFLEILSSQELVKRDNYYVFASKMFIKDATKELRLQNDPRVLKEGMQKNVRFIGDNVKEATPIIQLDPKKSAFFPAVRVGDFLQNFLPGRDDLDRMLSDDRNLKMATKQIKGLTVITTHLTNNRSFTVHGITAMGANRMTFDLNGQPCSVADYCMNKYQHRLRSPGLPCLIEKRPKRGNETKPSENYYPLEVCDIVAGQRVSIDKQTPQLVEQMIRNCQVLPKQFRDLNKKQQEEAFITNGNPFFRSHMVRVDTELMAGNAEVLFPPAVVYDREMKEEPDQQGQMNWKLGNKRFVIPANTPPVWAAVIFQNGVNGGACDQFINKILDSARQRGMNVQYPTRSDNFESTDINYVREKLKFYADNNCKFVLFFTRDKLDDVHHTMKLMEVELGITTQHVSKQTMEKAIGQKGAFMVIDNLLLKFNLKLGGINHSLSTAGALQRGNRHLSHDVIKQEWLRDSRMFIGLDMSHASPQSLYERQAGIAPTEPTIVGMVYTTGHPLRMRGTYWCQTSRLTYIEKDLFKSNMTEALTNYYNQMNRYPQQLVVFRGGVSEGEYRIVVQEEESVIREVLQELATKQATKMPDLVIIVVQRNSNYRIVPFNVNPNGKPFEQNVRAGTCLDHRVMHPAQTEFLLVGHKTIQGTAHPIRCTVICDTAVPRIPLEELEYVTYSLCYAHGIVLSPVSVPAPLYSASDLAKRGRNNWKCSNFDNQDNVSVSSGGSGGKKELNPHFFINMSQSLKPTIETKFWA